MGWNFNDNTPIYLQIINGLQREIASGAYPPGSRLASVRELALEAGVNPNTMQRQQPAHCRTICNRRYSRAFSAAQIYER